MPKRKVALTRVQKKQVRAIAAKTIETKTEQKVYEPGAASNLACDSTVTITQLLPSSGAQGLLSKDRVGDKIHWKSLSLKGKWAPTTNTAMVMRIMIVQYRGSSLAAPTAPPLTGYTDATATGVLDNMTCFYQRKQGGTANPNVDYKILYDAQRHFDANNSSPIVPWEIRLSEKNFMNSQIVYTTGSAVHDDPIYMFTFSNDASLGQIQSFRYRSVFTDI